MSEADQTIGIALGARAVSSYGTLANNLVVSPADRRVLRGLAARVAELAARPIEREKRELWCRHNGLEATRPVIFCEPDTSWSEIIPPGALECEGGLTRRWELHLRQEIFWGSEIRDDRVVVPTFDVTHVYRESDWGMAPTMTGGQDGGSYVWDAPLKRYEDMGRLHYPRISVDYKATGCAFDLANETLGDLLTVRLKTAWWWTLGMTWTLVDIRGLEQMMLDMIDHPDDLHRLMAFLRDGHLAKLDFLQENGLLSLNTDGTYVGSGGFGWTDELPQTDFDGHVRTCDMWGFAESQETVGVSPGMFAEFVFQYQLPILQRFGLNCYGCCEPLDKRWHIVERVPHLRRVSISPWADKAKMAERLGDRYIYSMKPRPADLAWDSFDEEHIRAGLRQDLAATRNCRLEVIMKDITTVRNDPRRLVRWTQIAREEAGNL